MVTSAQNSTVYYRVTCSLQQCVKSTIFFIIFFLFIIIIITIAVAIAITIIINIIIFDNISLSRISFAIQIYRRSIKEPDTPIRGFSLMRYVVFRQRILLLIFFSLSLSLSRARAFNNTAIIIYIIFLSI